MSSCKNTIDFSKAFDSVAMYNSKCACSTVINYLIQAKIYSDKCNDTGGDMLSSTNSIAS